MKVKFLLVLILGLVFTPSLTATAPQRNFKEEGRQCCTKTIFLENGSSISITACAGWFLSNNARAMTRACRKVNRAMETN